MATSGNTMKRYEVQCTTGCTKSFVEVNGLACGESSLKRKPPGDFIKHLANIKDLEIREDDIYVATFVKSGTHWIWEIIRMILKGGAAYEENVKETAMLEFRKTEELKDLPSPRVLNCHYPVNFIPAGVLQKRCKIVHVMRNIKDVVVSYLNHHIGIVEKDGVPAMGLDDILSLYLGEHGFYLNYRWTDYIREWEALAKERPRQVLNITYEDMKRDTPKEVKKVAHFLGMECSDNLASEIAEKCSFKKLKQANKDVKKHVDEKIGVNDFMYRKGEVGD